MNARQLAFITLQAVHRGAYADVAVERSLRQHPLTEERERRLATELIYGCVRRQRTLDALVDQLAKKPARQHPPDLRTLLHLGLYQLRYLNHIPANAAVHTTVELVKHRGLAGLAGFVNGLLRQYIRQSDGGDPLSLPTDPVQQLALLHSYPDWIVANWIEQIGTTETDQLCQWLNRPPSIDLRINPLQTSIEQVGSAFQSAGVSVQPLAGLPQGLRLTEPSGAIEQLPGFAQGWWSVQDASAQLVSHLLNPQPGEIIIDACAAPGGKSTHIAELIGDEGIVWACDRTPSRLKKLEQNRQRLKLNSIRIRQGDSRMSEFTAQADRVLLDAPCSGLGTLHRHADARWRQTPESVAQLAQLQTELLHHTATWVKPGGTLVYATCTLHPAENETVIQHFLAHHPQWQIQAPRHPPFSTDWLAPQGWIKVWPHRHQMDGFFMVQLGRS